MTLRQYTGHFFPTFLSIGLLLILSACDNSNEPQPQEAVERTLIMYYPWSTDLTNYFIVNIDEMEEAIAESKPGNQRVIVYFADTETTAELYEITVEGNKCKRQSIKSYSNFDVTTADGIASVLTDISEYSPSPKYSMIIGCHGMGWIPVDDSKSKVQKSRRMHWDTPCAELTRYFGGHSTDTQTNISDLAEGIANAGLKMEYILFDDCYMANVEVAYELRHSTDHLIASTSEIMAYGMPYNKIGKYLLGEPDYKNICQEFYDFYSSYSTPCGTLSVIDCSEIDELAAIMKLINQRYSANDISGVQKLDGYSPSIFFDMDSYVASFCSDENLLSAFRSQLERAVPYTVCTEYLYSMLIRKFKVDSSSGITISDPSTNSLAAAKTGTPWWAATH